MANKAIIPNLLLLKGQSDGERVVQALNLGERVGDEQRRLQQLEAHAGRRPVQHLGQMNADGRHLREMEQKRNPLLPMLLRTCMNC
jgi:hypothetical protein